MVHLSVAIGRFVEALFWAMARVAGLAVVAAVAMAIGGAVVFLIASRLLRRR